MVRLDMVTGMWRDYMLGSVLVLTVLLEVDSGHAGHALLVTAVTRTHRSLLLPSRWSCQELFRKSHQRNMQQLYTT